VADVSEGDGHSLLAHFGEGAPPFTRPVAFSQNHGFTAAITDRYKLVVHDDSGEPVQLFDLAADPDEDRNLVADPNYAGVRDELLTAYARPYLAAGVMRQPTVADRVQVVIGRAGYGRD
jgi:arylsulfatase A-like enzyme